MSKKYSAYSRKATFWSKQRVEKKLTLREVGELVGEDEKRVSAYFTGFLMPKDDVIKQLCELFDIDFKKGQLEFQHAHRDYVAEHGAKVKYSSSPRRPSITNIESVEDVLTTLYGVLSCKEFIAIYDAIIGNADETVNPLKILYNKVDDFDTYNKLVKIITGKNLC